MESGNVVEFIDRQNIICAVVKEIKNKRLRLLTENNKEVNLSKSRLSHQCKVKIDLSMGRDKTVNTLNEIVKKRKALISHIDIKELWEILNTEQEWIDLLTMTEFCFPDNSTCDHESAVVRAFFNNRIYFKFDSHQFFPNSEQTVEQYITKKKKIEKQNRIIQKASDWLRNLSDTQHDPLDDEKIEFINILKSYYIFQNKSRHASLAQAILNNAGIQSHDTLLKILIKLGEFDEDENIDIHRYGIPTEFSRTTKKSAEAIKTFSRNSSDTNHRRDLTSLKTMTIDGQATLDFDDAISIEIKDNHYLLGIHIVDVGYFIQQDDPIDKEALERGSSIYMADRKVSMLPKCLAEGLCSLKANTLRPSISVMVDLNKNTDILSYEICASMVNVKDQLTYYDVNTHVDEDENIAALYEIAKGFRQNRFDNGAVQITLPEINVWINEKGEINVGKVNRESPARMMVSEIMIMANWLMAKYLVEHHIPAIFRSQPKPRERLYKGMEGTLFQNYMQRKHLSRFILQSDPEPHSGLGLDAYVTATSPIRKYTDLITQRQIRALLGLGTPLDTDRINNTIQILEEPMSRVMKTQYRRSRYWLLKYLEQKRGAKEPAMVLYKKKSGYQILLPEYMMECHLPLSNGINLKPEDLIRVTLQHIDARSDILSVFMG